MEWTRVFFSWEVLTATMRVMAPILLVGLGALIANQAGVVNIGLEGLMLIGCFAGFSFNQLFASFLMGMLGAMVCTMACAMLFGVFVIKLKANQLVAGVAMNLLGDGLTVYLMSTIYGVKGFITSERLQPIPTVNFSLLRDDSALGRVIDNQSLMVWLALAMVLVMFVLLNYTRFGYHVRAAGQNADALGACGVNVERVRFVSLMLHGMLIGLGGCYLSTGYLSQFVQNMTSGRGYIALAAVTFGGNMPLGVCGATALFALIETLSTRLQSVGFPSYFSQMMPYVVTIVVLAITAYRKLRKGNR